MVCHWGNLQVLCLLVFKHLAEIHLADTVFGWHGCDLNQLIDESLLNESAKCLSAKWNSTKRPIFFHCLPVSNRVKKIMSNTLAYYARGGNSYWRGRKFMPNTLAYCARAGNSYWRGRKFMSNTLAYLCQSRESLLKGKDKYGWPPRKN